MSTTTITSKTTNGVTGRPIILSLLDVGDHPQRSQNRHHGAGGLSAGGATSVVRHADGPIDECPPPRRRARSPESTDRGPVSPTRNWAASASRSACSARARSSAWRSAAASRPAPSASRSAKRSRSCTAASRSCWRTSTSWSASFRSSATRAARSSRSRTAALRCKEERRQRCCRHATPGAPP